MCVTLIDTLKKPKTVLASGKAFKLTVISMCRTDRGPSLCFRVALWWRFRTLVRFSCHCPTSVCMFSMVFSHHKRSCAPHRLPKSAMFQPLSYTPRDVPAEAPHPDDFKAAAAIFENPARVQQNVSTKPHARNHPPKVAVFQTRSTDTHDICVNESQPNHSRARSSLSSVPPKQPEVVQAEHQQRYYVYDPSRETWTLKSCSPHRTHQGLPSELSRSIHQPNPDDHVEDHRPDASNATAREHERLDVQRALYESIQEQSNCAANVRPCVVLAKGSFDSHALVLSLLTHGRCICFAWY